ncbi:MAG: carbamoyl-phosphate synthase small subunit, partial [Gammaproteobacteria bacterium]|nr:carbamoyl-phosphate synthase small subunit [Gammaproteobacteria bacterium]
MLILEDGSLFRGASVGASGFAVGEVVFNTAMSGYQEILTDPSYARQIVTLTTSHVGNTGVNPEDNESQRVWAEALVVRDVPATHESWRAAESLPEFLARRGVVAIADIDTRRLTRLIREKGALAGCVATGDAEPEEALARARAFPGLAGMDLAQVVRRDDIAAWDEGTWSLESGHSRPPAKH